VAAFDIISETLRATNLGGLEPGSAVNFERSARMGDEIGGHNVSGHIHTTASVSRIEESPNNRRITFQARPPAWRAPLAHLAMHSPLCSPIPRWTSAGCVSCTCPSWLRLHLRTGGACTCAA